MDVRGWVYVISNPAMPDLVKVGFSLKDPALRAQELDGTGIPHPYKVEYEALVVNPRLVEQRAHVALAQVHERKEWFRCSVGVAVSALRDIAGEGILIEKQEADIMSVNDFIEYKFVDGELNDIWKDTIIEFYKSDDPEKESLITITLKAYISEKEEKLPIDEAILFDDHFVPWKRDKHYREHVRSWIIEFACKKIKARQLEIEKMGRVADLYASESAKLARILRYAEGLFFDAMASA